jgi:hypothetical protein
MELQPILNFAFGLIGVLFGWLLKLGYDSINLLQADAKRLAVDIQAIELLVAGQYIKRDDMERYLDKQTGLLMGRFDHLEKQLLLKADK